MTTLTLTPRRGTMDITEARRKAGLTQEQLADRLGISAATVGRWERGVTEPSPLQLCGVAAACDLDLGDLGVDLRGDTVTITGTPAALAVVRATADALGATIEEGAA